MSKQKQSGEILYRLIHEPGVHIASSHKTNGRFRANLLDDKTNKPDGFAELEPVYVSEIGCDSSDGDQENQQKVELSPEMQEFYQYLAEAIIELTIHVVKEFVAPPVRRLWKNKTKPSIMETLEILTGKTKYKFPQKGNNISKLPTNAVVIAPGNVQGISSHEFDEKFEKYLNDMTSEEAQRELLEIFIHLAMAKKGIRKLSNARIKSNADASGEYLDGQEILERLITPEYIDSINQILENNPQLMEEKTSDLSKILGRDLVLNGQYVPIETGKLKETMALQADHMSPVINILS